MLERGFNFFSCCRQTISGKLMLEVFYFKWGMQNVEKKDWVSQDLRWNSCCHHLFSTWRPKFLIVHYFLFRICQEWQYLSILSSETCMHAHKISTLSSMSDCCHQAERRSWISSALFCLYEVWLVSTLKLLRSFPSIALQVLTLYTHCLPSFLN